MSDLPRLEFDTVELDTQLGPIDLVITAEKNATQIVDPGFDGGEELFIEPTVFARNYVSLMRSRWLTPSLIHAGASLQMLEPVPTGSTVQSVGRISEKFSKRGRNYMVISSETLLDGRVVCRETNTLAFVAVAVESS